jgi:NAD-dependent deacetylase
VGSLDSALRLLEAADRILVFTGAGISTDSGIPDFRGPDGVWTRRRGWERRLSVSGSSPEPNRGHHAVTRLWEGGLLVGCVTQNVDGLHRTAGLPEEALVELHGSSSTCSCMSCGSTHETKAVLEQVRNGDGDPHCDCGGLLKPDVVFFGEMLPGGAMQSALEMAGTCDLVLAVGTTLSVFPAAGVPIEAMRHGADLVILNKGRTDLDDVASAVVDTDVGEALEMAADSLL